MNKPFIKLSLLCVLLALLAAAVVGYLAIPSVPGLFKRNAELKAMGYYMGEFEFKMIAGQYEIDQRRYLEALRTLRRVEAEMRSTEGLNKMPDHASPQDQMAFLLARQDPVTGAFMDRRYPAFLNFAPTCNVLEALAGLARKSGEALVLKHPLRFLDDIRTPEQLRAYLDSLLYAGELSARFPGPGPYGPGVSELAGFDALEQAGVHRFSEEWKTALRRWFYETQDPATGFWGARIGTAENWRQKTDINATFHILKLVLAETGENQDARFPLRHADRLARGVLELMHKPLPGNAAEQHDWGLVRYQGAKMLTNFLWPHLSAGEQDQVRRSVRSMLVQNYQLYRPADGGFAYYSSDSVADIDGTGLATGVLKVLGVLSGTPERARLWGEVSESSLTPRRVSVPRWADAELPDLSGIQSLRVYRDRLPATTGYDDADLVQILYPRGAQGLDVMDLRQGLFRFVNHDGAVFGNWKSKSSLSDLPLRLDVMPRPVPVRSGQFDLAEIARQHPASTRFYVVAYDIVQIPVQVIEFTVLGHSTKESEKHQNSAFVP